MNDSQSAVKTQRLSYSYYSLKSRKRYKGFTMLEYNGELNEVKRIQLRMIVLNKLKQNYPHAERINIKLI